MNDLRFALRQLLKNPGFAATAALTLALGIGATTAMFSVIYGVLIKPYPYARPDEIWTPGLRSPAGEQRMRSYRPDEYAEMSRLPVFEQVMATSPGSLLLTGDFSPETVRGIRVSANAFGFLGVPPLFGRTIQPSDISAGGVANPVTVLSFKRWQRLFGSDPNILGKTLRLDDRHYTIVGVMPPRFGWWTDDGVWLLMGIDTSDTRGVFPITRLKPGISAVAAEQQLHGLHREFAKSNPSGFPKEEFATTLTNYLDITAASGTMQRSLRLLFGAGGFLLLIACANVANLQLARATTRAREMAIRLSIGASRAQLIRQLLTESVLLSVCGGLLGLLFAVWVTNLMAALMPGSYVPNEARIQLNLHVLGFCALVSIVTGIVFGMAPALQASRANLANALKNEGHGLSASRGGYARAGLVVTEVALSVVLLVSAGLTIRSFVALQQVDLGFQPERVMTFELPLPRARYATWDQRNRFAQELLERVRNLPGVVAATIGNGGLPFGGPRSTFAIEGRTEPESGQILLHLADADYLRTLGVPLLAGRMPSEREIQMAEPVAVLNESAARSWRDGQDPIGSRVRLDELARPGRREPLASPNPSPFVTIIGVMRDTRNDGQQNRPQPAVLVPYTILAPSGRTLAVRTLGEPRTLANAVRGQVQAMDKEQPLNGPTTIQEILGMRAAQPRFLMALFSLFASLGLALAMAGIYGVLSFVVSKRTREIGVRMALGAQRQDIVRLTLMSGVRLAGAGLIVGIPAALAAARVISSQVELFQVGAADPAAFLLTPLLLAAAALAACYFPARRAAKVDPMAALRSE